jgi:hypothetical protein
MFGYPGTSGRRRVDFWLNALIRQAVDVAAFRQQPLGPEAEEKHEDCADHDLAQSGNDVRISRHVGEEAG